MSTAQQLVHQIIDIASQISAIDGPSVAVSYSSITNQIRVTAKQLWNEPAFLDESIELYFPDVSELARRRVDRQLQELITQLNGILVRNVIPPRPAA